jgi:hypothetical protein
MMQDAMMHLKNSMHNGSAAAAAAAAAAVAGVDLYKDVAYGKGKICLLFPIMRLGK